MANLKPSNQCDRINSKYPFATTKLSTSGKFTGKVPHNPVLSFTFFCGNILPQFLMSLLRRLWNL